MIRPCCRLELSHAHRSTASGTTSNCTAGSVGDGITTCSQYDTVTHQVALAGIEAVVTSLVCALSGGGGGRSLQGLLTVFSFFVLLTCLFFFTVLQSAILPVCAGSSSSSSSSNPLSATILCRHVGILITATPRGVALGPDHPCKWQHGSPACNERAGVVLMYCCGCLAAAAHYSCCTPAVPAAGLLLPLLCCCSHCPAATMLLLYYAAKQLPMTAVAASTAVPVRTYGAKDAPSTVQ
jgi:hypothetical protein